MYLLVQLIDNAYIEGNYKPKIFTRRCRLCGNMFVDSFHHIRIATTFGYDPYCQECAGEGGSEWFNLEMKPFDNHDESNDLELLKNYANAINTVPTKETMRNVMSTPCEIRPAFDAWVRLPSYKYYISKYGDFRVPLIRVGLLYEKVLSGKFGCFCMAKDGHKCRSLAELKIDNFMRDNNIEHEIEPLYPYHEIYNKNKKKRADWKVGNIYIEYWGLEEQESYANNMRSKIKLAEELGFIIVGITPSDLVNLESIFENASLLTNCSSSDLI